MCTRFFISEEVIQKAYTLSDTQAAGVTAIHPGDIHPSERTIVLAGEKNQVLADLLFWGFPRMDTKALIVNARSETIHEKRMFQTSALHSRCIIPVSGFYEWDTRKNIARFTNNDSPVLYLAGLSQGTRFTVLTTEANDSVRPVHSRMPVLIAENEIRDWILDNQIYKELLKRPMPVLTCWQENEQLSLF